MRYFNIRTGSLALMTVLLLFVHIFFVGGMFEEYLISHKIKSTKNTTKKTMSKRQSKEKE